MVCTLHVPDDKGVVDYYLHFTLVQPEHLEQSSNNEDIAIWV